MLRGFYYAKLRAAVWTAVSGLLSRISELRPRQALSAARSSRRASTHGRPGVFRSRSVLCSAYESPVRVSDDVLTQFAHIDVRSEVREDDCNAREAILLGLPQYCRGMSGRCTGGGRLYQARCWRISRHSSMEAADVRARELRAHTWCIAANVVRCPSSSATAAPTTRIRRTTGRHPCTLIPPQEA